MAIRSRNRLHQRHVAACIAACLMSGAAADDLIHHDVHEHGVTRLDVALADGDIVLALHGPMTNFAGFEHAPATGDQRQALNAAVRHLNDPARLMTLDPQAGCALRDTSVTVPDFDAAANHGRHDHGHGHGHEHEHEHEHDQGTAHHDLIAEYAYTCDRDPRWLTLEATLFDEFPWTRSLQTSIVGPNVQKREELDAHSRRVTLDR